MNLNEQYELLKKAAAAIKMTSNQAGLMKRHDLVERVVEQGGTALSCVHWTEGAVSSLRDRLVNDLAVDEDHIALDYIERLLDSYVEFGHRFPKCKMDLRQWSGKRVVTIWLDGLPEDIDDEA